MAKSIYKYAIDFVCENLTNVTFEVISVEETETQKRDDKGKPVGNSEKNLRFTVEAPKGNGYLSKIPFSVKLPMSTPKFDVSVLDNESVFIRFVDLELTFIDIKRNVYFRASDYVVVEQEFNL